MDYKYSDISSIVKRLDKLFENNHIDGDIKKCQHCGEIKNINDFYKQSFCCNDCWDKHIAIKGLRKSINSFILNCNYNPDDFEINTLITPDIIKLKVILNKLTVKLKKL